MDKDLPQKSDGSGHYIEACVINLQGFGLSQGFSDLYQNKRFCFYKRKKNSNWNMITPTHKVSQEVTSSLQLKTICGSRAEEHELNVHHLSMYTY